jgi:DNA-binding MarR family transcriptional regulator
MAKNKAGAKTGAGSLDRSPSHLLHKAVQRALDIYAEEFGPGAITQRQFAVLAAASERDGATQADLVRTTGIDRSTLADMAARMITKGLLERERSASDGRANAVRLTQVGRAALEEARPKMAAADTRLLRLVGGGGRRAAFVELLSELVSRDEGERSPKADKPPKPAKLKPPKPEKIPKKLRKKT